MKKIIQVFTVPIILGITTILLHLNVEQTLFTWIIFKVFVVLTLASHLFAFPAFLYSLKDNLSVIESYKKAKGVALSLLFVLVLYFIFTFGGTLFLIIPGIIFAVIFSLAFFAVIFEEKKGWSALWRSRELVSGKGWYVFGLFLFIGIIFGILQGVSNLIIEDYRLNYLFVVGYFLSVVHYIALWVVLFNFYERRKKEAPSIAKPRGIKKAFYIVPAIPGTVLFLIYFVFAFSILFRDYDHPLDDSHLLTEEKEVEEEGNLHFFLKENYGEYELEHPEDHVNEQSYYEFTKENPEKVEEIVEKNEDVYDYFKEMASHQHFTSPFELELSVWPGELLAVSRAVSLKTTHLLYNDRIEEGMDLFLDNLRIGYLFANDEHQDEVGLLTGVAYQRIVYGNMLPVLDLIDVSPQEAKKYQNEVASLEIEEGALSRALSVNYTLNTKMLDEGLPSDPNFLSNREAKTINAFIAQPSFFYKRNETMGIMAKIYAPVIEGRYEDIKSGDEIQDMIMEIHIGDEIGFTLQLLRGNIIGKILNNAALPTIDYQKELDSIRCSILSNRVLRVVLALNVYERKEGELPEKLEELVPEYFDEIPGDPFYEKQGVQYSKEERTIYSLRKEEVLESEKKDYIFEF